MIFKVNTDKSLIQIHIPLEDEDVFLRAQKNGKLEYIKVLKAELPKYSGSLKINKLFYKRVDEKIILDIDRILNAWIDKLYLQIESILYLKYPQSKQSSDLADKLYFENALKAKGVKTLEKTIVTKITAFNDGKTFDEILDGVADENKEAMAQLLKVGIRISWVQACKSELKTAIAENREPVYPEFPEI